MADVNKYEGKCVFMKMTNRQENYRIVVKAETFSKEYNMKNDITQQQQRQKVNYGIASNPCYFTIIFSSPMDLIYEGLRIFCLFFSFYTIVEMLKSFVCSRPRFFYRGKKGENKR
jgi:hypothetical protein